MLLERVQPFRNREFARAAGLKSVEAKRKLKLEAAEQLATAKAMLTAGAAVIASSVPSAAPANNDYANRRLARVRLQLDSLDKLIADEMASRDPDAAKLDRYASAQARLATQEQQLAGRPLPGSRRPGKDRGNRGSAAGGGAGMEIQPED